MTELEDNSFSESILKSIIFNSNIKSIGEFCFRLCYNLKEVNLSKIKIKTLEYGTFHYSGLEIVYLPKGLLSMKEVVFGNSPLKIIFLYSQIPPDFFDFISKNATFENVNINQCVVHVPKGMINAYRENKKWNSFSIIIDDIIESSYEI